MRLFIFSLMATLATLFLLLVGGTVNPTGSSLACPDWPTCYGSFFPEMVGGVFYEHSHRIVATLVGFLTLILTVWLWIAYKPSSYFRVLGVFAFILVVIQGVLGGVTVLLKLPPVVSISHLAISMVFFALLITITYLLWQDHRHIHVRKVMKDLSHARLVKFRSMFAVASVLVYAQILLGALVRHIHAGHTCGTDFLLCGGVLWPENYFGQIHMLHRFFAYGLMGYLVVISMKILPFVKHHHMRWSYVLTMMIPWLTMIQIMLGMLTVMSGMHVNPAAAHLTLGATLLAVCWLIFLNLTTLMGETKSVQMGFPKSLSHS